MEVFARRYDLSRGESDCLQVIFRDLFLALQPIERIAKLQELCCSSINVKKSFQEALKQILADIQEERFVGTLLFINNEKENDRMKCERSIFGCRAGMGI